MIRAAVIGLLVLAGCAEKPGPCPADQARNGEGKCVALAESLPPGFVLDKPTPPPPGYVVDAPAKDEYLADQDAIADFNREQLAKRAAEDARDDAEWKADRRADRIVEAQRDTQRELKRVADKLD